MPPTPSTSAAPADPICNSCGTNTGLDRIDATKLNDLFNTLTNRLSRDVQGNFFVEGAKTGKDTRHGQLGDLYSLRAQLDGFKTTMDKYITLHAPKEKEAEEKPASINVNKSQKAAIAEMVETQVKERFRDLSIRCERLEEDVSKVKERKGGAKAGAGVMKTQHDDCPANAAINKLTKRLDIVVKDQAVQEKQIGQVNDRSTGLGITVAALELWKKRKDAQQSNIVDDVSDIKDRLTSAEAEQKGFSKWIDKDLEYANGLRDLLIERFQLLGKGLALVDPGFSTKWRTLLSKQAETIRQKMENNVV
ncbi:hypothetical protein LTR10_006349 [Elasticomyces elasticus]|nr:hypothetical protein LTR10_006349 [Elasticomyces elasticus]KAK4966603.1 hypothetical protein LTR42_010914 [Elasticomyces elasticus]